MAVAVVVVMVALAIPVLAGCGRQQPSEPPGRGGSGNSGGASERFLAHRVLDDDRTLRLVYGASSSHGPREVELRDDDDELGVTVYRSDPEVHLMDLWMHCAEVELPEPVGGRRVVDDSGAEFNPNEASLEVARKVAAGQMNTCERVPVK